MALVVTVVLLILIFGIVSLFDFNSGDQITGNVVREDSLVKDYQDLYQNSFKLKSLDRVFFNSKTVVFLRGTGGVLNEGKKSEIEIRDKVLVSINNYREERHLVSRPLSLGKMHSYFGLDLVLIGYFDGANINEDWGELVFPYDTTYDYMGYFNIGDVKKINGHEVEMVDLAIDQFVDIRVDGELVRLQSFSSIKDVNGLKVSLDEMSFDRARLFFKDVKSVDF